MLSATLKSASNLNTAVYSTTPPQRGADTCFLHFPMVDLWPADQPALDHRDLWPADDLYVFAGRWSMAGRWSVHVCRPVIYGRQMICTCSLAGDLWQADDLYMYAGRWSMAGRWSVHVRRPAIYGRQMIYTCSPAGDLWPVDDLYMFTSGWSVRCVKYCATAMQSNALIFSYLTGSAGSR